MKDHTLFVPVAVPVMLRYRGLLLTVAFCLYSTSLAVECFSGVLPDFMDCQILISTLFYLSRMPGQNDPKEYGRTVQSDMYSEKIPKLYYLHGPEEYNCAILVDVDAADYYAVDTFRIEDLAVVGNTVFVNCLLSQGKLGLYVYRAPISAGSASES